MDEEDLCIVTLSYPHANTHGTGLNSLTDNKTWLTLIKAMLSIEYIDYKLTVSNDPYNRVTTATIEFANVEDATLFKLQKI